MYCNYCGNKILDTNRFCSKCGVQIINSITCSDINFNYSTKENSPPKLPMNWYKFWKYARFPLSIVLSAINIAYYLLTYNLELNLGNIFLFLIDMLTFILMYVTYYNFYVTNSKGYKLIIFWLFFELFYYPLILSLKISLELYSTLLKFAICFCVTSFLFGLIWTLPNYIYFKKRKYFFSDKLKH